MFNRFIFDESVQDIQNEIQHLIWPTINLFLMDLSVEDRKYMNVLYSSFNKVTITFSSKQNDERSDYLRFQILDLYRDCNVVSSPRIISISME
jgi:hypothetical protein